MNRYPSPKNNVVHNRTPWTGKGPETKSKVVDEGAFHFRPGGVGSEADSTINFSKLCPTGVADLILHVDRLEHVFISRNFLFVIKSSYYKCLNEQIGELATWKANAHQLLMVCGILVGRISIRHKLHKVC